MFMIFLIYTTNAILTSEISARLKGLKDLDILIEVVNLNKDSFKTSYVWNSIKPLDAYCGNFMARYRHSNISYSNDMHWKLYSLAQDSKEILEIYLASRTYWDSFEVFIIHSEEYPLKQAFYFNEDSDCCNSFNISYLILNETIIIYANPLENIDIHSIHQIFSKEYFIDRLKHHEISKKAEKYLNLIQNLEKSLKPITVCIN
jgi:hypothetical protein